MMINEYRKGTSIENGVYID